MSLAAATVLTALLAAPAAHAQSIEPRAYANAPVDVNFLVAGPAYATGGFSIDPSLPLEDPELETSYAILGYARSTDFWGRSGKFDVVVPYSWLNGSATIDDEPVHRRVRGFADPSLRVSINLLGAPALSMKDFASYRQDLIVGASLQVTAPWGQYDEKRRVNIGANRWSFRPGLGVSKALGRWTLEGIAAKMRGKVLDLALAAGDHWLITARDDNVASVWVWQPGDLIAQACHQLSRNLTAKEWQEYLGPEPLRRHVPTSRVLTRIQAPQAVPRLFLHRCP